MSWKVKKATLKAWLGIGGFNRFDVCYGRLSTPVLRGIRRQRKIHRSSDNNSFLGFVRTLGISMLHPKVLIIFFVRLASVMA